MDRIPKLEDFLHLKRSKSSSTFISAFEVVPDQYGKGLRLRIVFSDGFSYSAFTQDELFAFSPFLDKIIQIDNGLFYLTSKKLKLISELYYISIEKV